MPLPTDVIKTSTPKTEYRKDIPVGAFDEYYPVDPKYRTAVEVIKDGEPVTYQFTTATKLSIGGKITDFSNADVPFFTKSTADTNDIGEGDNSGISCIRLSGTSVTNVIKVDISQF